MKTWEICAVLSVAWFSTPALADPVLDEAYKACERFHRLPPEQHCTDPSHGTDPAKKLCRPIIGAPPRWDNPDCAVVVEAWQAAHAPPPSAYAPDALAACEQQMIANAAGDSETSKRVGIKCAPTK
jgi:hypothetical protein